MQLLSSILSLVVLLLVARPSSQTFGTTSNSAAARVCVLRNCNLNSTVNVCGRNSWSSCRRFSNLCQMRYYQCVTSTTYTSVALTQCSGLSVGSSGTCRSSSSSSSLSSSSLLSGLSSSSSSNVVPIIIRRG
ncbi:uncharacterized protein LOC115622255 [Scaptodrosophila lebanonensis]|uniref:Uncharacterized protein LOC115622255 n=1 Tax=Drosophila lebanonensis TaxID=7225 RepID=A0A6J2T7P4_DROLE|nr:uncharacterized protein LOC115622255 [Scaptodrosophila lebanonensis]